MEKLDNTNVRIPLPEFIRANKGEPIIIENKSTKTENVLIGREVYEGLKDKAAAGVK